MSYVPTNNGAKVELLYSVDGQKLENVLNFHVPNDLIDESAIALAAEIVDWYDTYLKPLVPNTVSLNGVRVTALHSPTGVQVEYTTGLPIVGSVAATALPSNVTVAVRLNTSSRGKSYTGRVFHVGLAGAQTAGNMIDAAHAGYLKAAYEKLIDPAVITTATLGVLSLITGKQYRTNGVITEVVGFAIDQILDSQRRRLPGRGK